MAMQETHSEPSMEEILASIRRIISEDEPAPEEDVLELSRPAPTPARAEDESGGDLLIFDQQPEPQDHWRAADPAPRPEPAPAPRPAPSAPMAEAIEHALMSDAKAAAAAGSFTRLAGNLRIAEAQGQTLEAVVRDLLRPMLRDWLEQNLPAIVESKVEAELDRISRLSR